MSLLLSVLFCLSLATMPILAIEDETPQKTDTTDTITEQPANPSGETPQEPGEPAEPIQQEGTDQNQQVPQGNGTQENGKQNGESGEKKDEENGTENGGSTNESDEKKDPTPTPPTTAEVPEGFFTKVQLGREYDQSTGAMTGFAGESNVDWDASCALLFNYKVPENTPMYAGTKYTFSVEAPLIIATDFNIVNEHNVVVATGRIEQSSSNPNVANGTVTFNDQAYLEADVTGCFFVQAMFNKAANPGTGKQDISITVTGNITNTTTVDFAAPEAKASVDLQKQSDAVTMLQEHKIEWTLTVTPKMENLRAGDEGRITSLVVTDRIDKEKLQYVSATGVTKDERDVSDQIHYNSETGELTFTGQDDDLKAKSWPITIKVITSYDLSNEKLTIDKAGNLAFSNSAHAEITAPQYVKKENGSVSLEDPVEGTGGQADSADATANATIAYASFDKQGALESGNTVTWTITATNAYKDDASYIKDTLPTHMKVSGNITLNGKTLTTTPDSTGAYYEYIENGTVLIIHLDKTMTGEQKVVYQTVFVNEEAKKEDIANMADITNKADFYFGPGTGHTLSKTANIHVGRALMSKSGSYDKQTHRVTWRVTLKTEYQSLRNIVLTDTFGQTVGKQKISQTYVPGSMKIIDTKTNTPRYISEGTDFTVADDKKSFTLNIATAHPQHEILEYQTELKDINGVGLEFWGNNADRFTINNTIRLTSPDLPPKAEVTGSVNGKSTVLVKEAGSYNYQDKTIQWKLKVNGNRMALTNGKIEDTLSGLEWIYAEDKGVSITQGGTQLTPKGVSYSEDKRTMTIELPDVATGSEEILITYYTTLANQNSLLTNDTLTVNNTAKLTGDEIVSGGVTVTASKTIGQNVLSKSLTKKLDANNELTWTVDVNRNLATIQTSDPDAKIGILDTLQEGLSYVEGSLVVKKLNVSESGAAEGDTLQEGKDYTVTYDKAERKLQVLWSGNQMTEAYRLTFRTLVMVSKQYTNSVSFVGVVQNTWSSSGGVTAYAMFGGGFTQLPAALGELDIVKKDGTTGAMLPETTFQIFDTDGVLIGTFTTDKDGKITTVLPVGWYTIEEVTPPNDYVLPTVHTWKVEVKSKQLTTETISNYQNAKVATYAPAVTKEVKGITASTEKFTFKLEAQNGAPMPLEDTAEVTGAGVARFGQIQYTAEGTYTYTITEQDGGAYRYTYDTKPHTLTVTVAKVGGELKASAKYDTDQDSLTITNTYRRPSGGGGGTVTPEPKPDPKPDPSEPVDPKPDPDQPSQPTDPDQPSEPDQPSTPDQPDTPSEPSTPSRPSRPSRPTVPTYPIDRLPDPSDPSSPDEIIIIDDDDVPLGNFYKTQEPDGSYAYVDKKGNTYGRTTPKGTETSGHTPKTGVSMTVPALAITGGLCAVGGAVLCFGGKKKKED